MLDVISLEKQFKNTMKNLLRKSSIKLIALGVIATTIITGCSKEKVSNTAAKPKVEETQGASVQGVSINVLKTYYADLIKADVKLITYDEKTEQILFFGVKQISREKLTEMYLANTKPNN
jgi:uncharacterized lipoprotein YajG